jgi:hypothetical protein
MPGTAAAGEPARFEFHSDPRVNLHHFLYHAARNDLRGEEKLFGRVSLREGDRNKQLSPADAAAFRTALEVYAELGDGDLLFDQYLSGIRTALATDQQETNEAIVNLALEAITIALPVYERHWWAAHDLANRARIEELDGMVNDYGEAIGVTLATRYESTWPDKPIRVDLSAYANWAGAYATDGPNHIIMSSGADRHPGMLSLEILFHEASHTMPLGEHIRSTSLEAADAAGVDEDDLWHSYVFYASGEAVRNAVPGGYQTYAEQFGLWNDGNMKAHHNGIADMWETELPLRAWFGAVHKARAR